MYRHINISENVIEYLCQQADIGYENPYKQERIGFLFGTKTREKIIINKAVAYKGGIKKRTRIDLNPQSFNKRAKELSKKFNQKWLGTYHTHVEESDNIYIGLSEDDKNSFMEDPTHIVLIVAIWATNNSQRLRPGRKRLLAIKRFGYTNYRYVISGYIKTKRGPKLTKIIRI